MSALPTTDKGQGDLPVTGSDDRTGGMALIAWIAREHGHAFSESALRAALPAGTDFDAPDSIARALATLGLKSRLVAEPLTRVDPAQLPCVLFRRDGSTVLLVEISANGRTFSIVEPANPSLRIDLKRRALKRGFKPEVMLVATDRRVGSGAGGAPERAGPRWWFWGPVRENWSGWSQIVVAALCLNLLSLALPLFVMNVYDRVIPNTAFVTLWTLAVGVGLALLLDIALRALRSSVLERIARRVDLRVASSLFDQAMNARLMSRPGGAAGIANSIRDFEAVRDFFGSASFVAVIDLMFIGIFIAALFLVVGPLAWVPLLAVPVVLILAVIAQIPLRRSAAEAQALSARRHVVLVESLLGIEAVKSLNGEAVMQREWEKAIAASTRIGGQTRFWSGLATSGTMTVQQGVSVGIIVWGVYLLSDGLITVGALIAANILAGRVLSPLAAIAQTIFRAHYAMSSMRALTEFMALPRERRVGAGVKSDLRVAQGQILFRDVSFRYPGAEHPALVGLDLTIEPGEVVALLGRVGSGKTTTGKLLNGLIEPDGGNILIDGHGIAQFDPAELRDGVGYLTQESELFTGTLRENMVIGRSDANEEEIRAALHTAGMDQFVAANSDGLDMHIGEKGNRLSGGQRQGIALARLLLRQTPVLFLDEPTNAMDQQMEQAVIARLGALGQGTRTLIFCTHRMSLANLAERFIVLDHGRKVLDGPRDEVLAQLRAAQSERLGA